VVWLSLHHTGWINPALYRESRGWNAPPPPGEVGIFPLFIKTIALSMRGAICPQAALDYVVFSRADGVTRSPERIVVSFMVLELAAQVTGRWQSEVPCP
jgi:hypothetical protein